MPPGNDCGTLMIDGEEEEVVTITTKKFAELLNLGGEAISKRSKTLLYIEWGARKCCGEIKLNFSYVSRVVTIFSTKGESKVPPQECDHRTRRGAWGHQTLEGKVAGASTRNTRPRVKR